MTGRGLHRSGWAWVVVALAATLFGLLLPFLLSRPTPPGSTPSPVAPSASPTPEESRVVAIGDSYTGGSNEGGYGAAGWPALLEQRIPNLRVTTAAAGGAGYVAVSPTTGQTLVQVALFAPVVRADVVIVFGSRNDGSGVADQVEEAAARTYAEIRAAVPTVTLVVIGPPWVAADVPPAVLANRDAVRRAAQAANAVFVDPIADRWFFDRPDLIAADHIQPTDAGHVYMADRIEPVLQAALASAGR
jgi:lysophospholipase L1-like esterase